MEAFVITLREGVETALIIGLVLAYLKRTGREGLRSWVYAGLVLAIIASLIAAFTFSQIGFDPENEIFEGVLYTLAAVLVATLVIWMWRASRSMKKQIEDQLDQLTSPNNQKYGWGLLVFVFFMVLREGVETVLFLAAFSLTNTAGATALIGGVAGLALAVVFGLLFIRGSVRINLRLFFAVTSIVLLVLAVRLAAGGLHEFYEAGVLALPHVIEEGIEILTARTTSTIILIVLVALPLLVMLPKRFSSPVNRQTSGG
jgi:FTR1 family protein